MSNQPNRNSQDNTSVYNEKKIASYESLFRESTLAKPLEVRLTITAAHLYGQAYIMEQQGTKEGDPVYERFICPLEDITKVYINNNVKASPLYVQCDTNVKGVVYRKRIIIPCLENVSEIVKQINSIRDVHMEKYEAAIEREKKKKREAISAARRQEQAESGSAVPQAESAPAPVQEAPAPVEETAPIEEAAAPAEEAAPASKSKSTRKKKEASSKQINELKKLSLDLDDIPDRIDIAKVDASEEFKTAAAEALEIFSGVKTKTPKTEDTVPVEDKAASVMDEIEKAISEAEAFAASVTSSAAVKESAPVVEEVAEEAAPAVEEVVEESAPAVEEVAEEAAPVVEEVVEESAPVVEEVVEEAAPVVEEAVEEAAPTVEVVVEEPAPVKTPSVKPVNPNGAPIGLEEFQNAVLKIKSMKENGLLTDEEFNIEKKKLLASLY